MFSGFFFLFFMSAVLFFLFFFFQAEDGIRDRDVTGVQTCALPIFCGRCTWTRTRGCMRSSDSPRNAMPPPRPPLWRVVLLYTALTIALAYPLSIQPGSRVMSAGP